MTAVLGRAMVSDGEPGDKIFMELGLVQGLVEDSYGAGLRYCILYIRFKVGGARKREGHGLEAVKSSKEQVVTTIQARGTTL